MCRDDVSCVPMAWISDISVKTLAKGKIVGKQNISRKKAVAVITSFTGQRIVV